MRPIKEKMERNRFNPAWLAVSREEIFSPGKVGDDAAILNDTVAALVSRGFPRPEILKAEDLAWISGRPCWVLSMAQSGPALAVLHQWTQQGTRIINSVESVKNCYRRNLIRILTAGGMPIPPSRMMPLEAIAAASFLADSGRCWLKRGDFHALRTGDVVQITSADQLGRAVEFFQAEAIAEVLVQEHVEGEVVKFYGTGPGDYFDTFMESSGRRIFPIYRKVMEVAVHAAELAGLEIFGGDAVVTEGGKVVLIDLNDWPSFSRCRRAAAERIADHAMRRCAGGASGAAE